MATTILLLLQGTVEATTISLGSAGYYAVAALNGQTEFSDSGSAVVNGDAFVGDSTGSPSLAFSNSAQINGTIFYDPSATINTSGSAHASGGMTALTSTQSNQIITDLTAALTAIDALPATQTFGNIGAATISGNGGLNVIDATGIALSGSDVLLLNGSVNDTFVVRVNGSITAGGSSQITVGAEGASNVIFVATGAIGLTGSDLTDGTFVSTGGDITLSDSGTHYGAFILDDADKLTLSGSARVNYVAYTYSAAPEPSTLVLLGIGAISLLAYAWRWRRTA